MDLRCNSCGSSNPAPNRYCGQCGNRLEQVAADPPRAFSLESPITPSEAAASSAYLPPYIIDLNNQSSALSGHGTDNPVREAGTNDEAQPVSETLQPPGQLRIVYENPITAASAPSNLGLSHDSAREYYDDEGQPHSRRWRNVALCGLGAAVILAALQWRSIRDYGVRQFGWASAQDYAEQRRTGAPKPPAASTDNAKITHGAAAAATKAGAPQASPNANHGQSVKPPGNPPNSAGTSAAPRALADATAPHAMGTPLRELPENQSPGIVGQRLNPAPSGSVRHERMAHGSSPGSDEMNRADKSSTAEERATWLWKAVGKGNSEAPVALAKMYAQGSGVAQSCDQAQILLRMAAANGNKEAKLSLRQNRLGGCAPR